MIRNSFTNEIGNKIKIKIKSKKNVGMNYKTKECIKHNGVSMTITGPTSTIENIITYKEAEELYKTLHNFLSLKRN